MVRRIIYPFNIDVHKIQCGVKVSGLDVVVGCGR